MILMIKLYWTESLNASSFFHSQYGCFTKLRICSFQNVHERKYSCQVLSDPWQRFYDDGISRQFKLLLKTALKLWLFCVVIKHIRNTKGKTGAKSDYPQPNELGLQFRFRTNIPVLIKPRSRSSSVHVSLGWIHWFTYQRILLQLLGQGSEILVCIKIFISLKFHVNS